jgi:hypothetical protein
VTELCSGQALADADADNDNDADTDAAAADTADKSNPYMSPFQGDTKSDCFINQFFNESLIIIKEIQLKHF